MIDLLKKIKHQLIPIIFLIVVINIPLVIFFNTAPRPDPPPPGWSSIWIYYLHGDYDYFFRLRIMPQTLPFWGIIGIFLMQMGNPCKFEMKVDLLINLILGLILTVGWMLLIHYIYIVNYTETWVANTMPFTPIIAMVAVPLHRITIHLKDDRAS